MSQLYLPADHTDADLVLATQLASRFDSAELHVAWTPGHGRVRPELCAVVREPAASPGGTLALLLGAFREILGALLSRPEARAAAPRAPRPALADQPHQL